MIKLPTARQAREIADWIEAELLFGERESISPTEMRGLLSDDLGLAEEWADVAFADDGQTQQELDDDEDRLQDTVEEAFLLLEHRAVRTGERYPLALTAGRWERSGEWTSALDYGFLVLLNVRVLLGLGGIVDHHTPAILFERLVRTALAAYVSGEAARFGVPHSDFDGDFPDRAKALAKLMRERPIRDLTTITPQQGDYGLDVAAWRSLDDRESKVVILCQCGIGDNFEDKALPVERWKRVIDFVCTPVTALAIPFQDFAPEQKIRTVALDAGLLLDRSRIARFADLEADETLADDITAWITSALPSFFTEEVGVG